MFTVLPREILKYELLPLLDDASLLCLQIALYVKERPSKLKEKIQFDIIRHGLTLTQYFDDKGLMNHSIMGTCAAGNNQVEILEYVLKIDSEKIRVSFRNRQVLKERI